MRPPEVLLQGAGLWGGRGKQALRQPAPLPGWVCVRSPASSVLGSSKGTAQRREGRRLVREVRRGSTLPFRGPGPPASSPDTPSSLLHLAGSAQAGKLLWDPFRPVQPDPFHGEFLLADEKQMASAWFCSACGIKRRDTS